MSEENKTLDVEKILKNKLKSISVEKLEDGISKVVSDLVGEDYKCSISDIRYSIFSGADFHVKIEISYNPDK
ncbi:MAG: hypothetical protein JW866_10445 [Ignavibacteriales bacterium]|nr:hypothetical protein [Ignavibacteriales bacterium]